MRFSTFFFFFWFCFIFHQHQQKSHLTQSLLAVKEEQENVLAQTEAAIEKIGDKKRPEIAAGNSSMVCFGISDSAVSKLGH